MPGLSPEAHRLAAVMPTVVVLWVSEALPMAVTALLGPVLAVVLQVAPARRALAPFADPIIFLFIGSFMLAEAMFVHGLDRRIAFTALSSRLVGTSATRMLVAYGAVATVISMWISNTATTAMMFPIGLSIVGAPRPARHGDPPGDAAVRHQHDAGDVVRRLGRRHGDAGRDAAEPDRHRLHRAAHRAATSTSSPGCARRAAGAGAVGVPRRFARWGARGLRIDARAAPRSCARS